jgi:3-deoxy-D-manno-octulosonic acid (KDO) 8-phosphate synthase
MKTCEFSETDLLDNFKRTSIHSLKRKKSLSRGIETNTNTKPDLDIDVLTDDFINSDCEEKFKSKKKSKSPLKKLK